MFQPWKLAQDTPKTIGDTAYPALRRPTVPRHTWLWVASTVWQKPHFGAASAGWPRGMDTDGGSHVRTTRHSPVFNQQSLVKEV